MAAPTGRPGDRSRYRGGAWPRGIDYPIAVAVDLRSLGLRPLLSGDLPGAVEAAGELLDDLLERGALRTSASSST